MGRYYTVKKSGDRGAVVTSANPIAKQIFFGWGAGDNRIDAQFYGNSTGRRGARGEQWQWKLDASAVYRMISNIRDHIDDRRYYEKKEINAARELLTKLEDIAREWG